MIHIILLATYIFGIGLAIYVTFKIGIGFANRVSPTVIAITNKVMGLTIAATAVAFINNGSGS